MRFSYIQPGWGSGPFFNRIAVKTWIGTYSLPPPGRAAFCFFYVCGKGGINTKANLGPCKDLYYLVTIAEEGSLTKAAEKLYVAQPSLSFFLKEIEMKIGVKIFTRVKTGLVPTMAGELVLSTAKKMLVDWETALDKIHDISNADPFVFATPAFRGTIILPAIMVDLHASLPELNFKFEEILTKNIPSAFETNKIKSAFMVNNKMPDEEYTNRKIIDEEIFMVGHPSHPMYSDAHRTSEGMWLEPDLLSKYNVIVLQLGHQLRKRVDSFFAEKNITPQKIVETSNIVTSIKMAESGIGITFLPSMFLPQCDCVPVSIGHSGLRWPIYLSSRKDSNDQVEKVLFNSIQGTYRSILSARLRFD